MSNLERLKEEASKSITKDADRLKIKAILEVASQLNNILFELNEIRKNITK